MHTHHRHLVLLNLKADSHSARCSRVDLRWPHTSQWGMLSLENCDSQSLSVMHKAKNYTRLRPISKVYCLCSFLVVQRSEARNFVLRKCLSVCPTVDHTRASRLHGSIYQSMLCVTSQNYCAGCTMAWGPPPPGSPDQLPIFYHAVFTSKRRKTFTNHKFRAAYT